MYPNDTRKILKLIITGNVFEGQKDNLNAARNFLCSRFSTSTKAEKNFDHQSAIKKEQVVALKGFCNKNDLILQNLPAAYYYLAAGGEAKVFYGQASKNVIKQNGAVYYSNWLDFLNSITIHNILFANTAYDLLGFYECNNELCAIVKQPFIIADAQTDLLEVRKFLAFNGFENTRRNDYYNKELGLILEDIHDENVLVNSNTLFFIDTVFYIHITQ